MSAWNLPPDYIVNNWTDELFALMIEKHGARMSPQETVSDGSGLVTASGGMIKKLGGK